MKCILLCFCLDKNMWILWESNNMNKLIIKLVAIRKIVNNPINK